MNNTYKRITKKLFILLIVICLVITTGCSNSLNSENSITAKQDENIVQTPPAENIVQTPPTENIVQTPPTENNTLQVKTLAVPVFPEMVLYPTLDGGKDFTDADSNRQYNKWESQKIERETQNKDYAQGLDSFLSTSISSFLKNSENENVVFSPLNLYMSLGMLSEITSGNSQKQILKALGSENIESVRSRASKMWNYSYRKDGIAKLLLANSLWLDTSIDYKKETLDILTKNYYASSYSGKMGSNELNELLHGWINEQTDNLLENQLPQFELTGDTILSLVSTVNFNAKWKDQFDKQNTEQGIFHSPKGDISVDYMKDTVRNNAYWGDKFTAISMSLTEEDYDMNIVLPDEGIAVSQLIDDTQVMQFLTNHKNYENKLGKLIDVTIPRFDVSYQNDLQKNLEQMGITDVFNSAVSDFSNITEKEGTTLKSTQGTRVMIDEDGCKAVSYKLFSVLQGIIPVEGENLKFVVDRPFIFTITDGTGTPIYAGIVNNP